MKNNHICDWKNGQKTSTENPPQKIITYGQKINVRCSKFLMIRGMQVKSAIKLYITYIPFAKIDEAYQYQVLGKM